MCIVTELRIPVETYSKTGFKKCTRCQKCCVALHTANFADGIKSKCKAYHTHNPPEPETVTNELGGQDEMDQDLHAPSLLTQSNTQR